jgi:hypothetical protein
LDFLEALSQRLDGWVGFGVEAAVELVAEMALAAGDFSEYRI